MTRPAGDRCVTGQGSSPTDPRRSERPALRHGEAATAECGDPTPNSAVRAVRLPRADIFGAAPRGPRRRSVALGSAPPTRKEGRKESDSVSSNQHARQTEMADLRLVRLDLALHQLSLGRAVYQPGLAPQSPSESWSSSPARVGGDQPAATRCFTAARRSSRRDGPQARPWKPSNPKVKPENPARPKITCAEIARESF